ncbi:hypothetical protein HR12_41445, partial [Microbacterium sp. SUBG005]
NTANSPVGVPAITQGSYIFMPGQDGYTDEALPYDTDAGAQYLEDAGYTKDGDSWVKDGTPLSFSVTVPADTATNIQRAEQIQADLSEFGIPVELNSVPVGGYFSDYIIPGDFEMVTFSWVGTAYPISSTRSLFTPVDSEQNFTGIADDRLGPCGSRRTTSSTRPSASRPRRRSTRSCGSRCRSSRSPAAQRLGRQGGSRELGRHPVRDRRLVD